MDCVELREILGELAGNRTEPGLQRAAEMHLERCPECARELAAMRAMLGELRTLEPMPVPAGFVERVRARAERARPAARLRGWLVPAISAAGAAAAILLLVFLWPGGAPMQPMQEAHKRAPRIEMQSKAPPRGLSTREMRKEEVSPGTGARRPGVVSSVPTAAGRPVAKTTPGTIAPRRGAERPITVAKLPPVTTKEGTAPRYAVSPPTAPPAVESPVHLYCRTGEGPDTTTNEATVVVAEPPKPRPTEKPDTLTRTPGYRDHAAAAGPSAGATSKAPEAASQVYLYEATRWADQPVNASQAEVMNRLAAHEPVTVSLGLVPGGGQAKEQMAFNVMANSQLSDTNVVMNYQSPMQSGIRAINETRLLWRGDLNAGQVAVVPLAPQKAPFIIRQAEIAVTAQGDGKGEISRKYLLFLPTTRGARPDTRISVNYLNVPLDRVIAEISDRAGLAIMVSMPVKGNVVLRGNAMPAGAVLRQVAQQQGYQVIPGPSAWTLLK